MLGEGAMAAVTSVEELRTTVAGHASWVRISHWILAASVLTLAFSGFEILMVHPRLYWGKAGKVWAPAARAPEAALYSLTANGLSL